MDIKTVSAVTKGTKRRRDDAGVSSYSPYSKAAMSLRLTRLARKMKLQNPVHLGNYSLGTQFPTVSTTGSIVDLSGLIQQGDDYNQRFSSQVCKVILWL